MPLPDMLPQACVLVALVSLTKAVWINNIVPGIGGILGTQDPPKSNVTARRMIFNDVYQHLGVMADHPFPGARLQIRNAQTTDRCVDFTAESRQKPVEPALKNCHNHDVFHQMIWLRPLGKTGFVILSVLDKSCMGSPQRSNTLTALTTSMDDKTCRSDPFYHFAIEMDGNAVRLKQRSTGRCLAGTLDVLHVDSCRSISLEQTWLLCKFHPGAMTRKLCWPPETGVFDDIFGALL